MGVMMWQNPEKGVTAGIYQGCRYDASSKIWRAMLNHKGLDEDHIAEMPNEIRAVVRVREGDTFDPEVGKRECFTKVRL